MAQTSTRDLEEVIAELEKKIEGLTATLPKRGARRRSFRRPAAVVGAAVLALGMLAGVAGASGTTTNVSFVSLNPAKALFTNASIAAHGVKSPVVIGGTTTVPSNATTVELTVSAKGTAGGFLHFYPAANPLGGSGQFLQYPSGNTLVSTTIQENVGQSSELTFFNAGNGSAVVTAKIIGYSTQVTAGDINGVGGTAGQVLTDDGAGGAAWQTPAVPSAANFSSAGGASGDVLTNTGTGATWAASGVSGYQVVQSPLLFVSPGAQAFGTVACPAGKIAVGGGAVGGDSHPGEDINGSAPIGAGSGWEIYMDNSSAATQNYIVYAVCVH